MTAPHTITDHALAKYGYPATDHADLEWGDYLFDDHQCKLVAEEWVANGGTPENLRAADELIARLIITPYEDDEDEPREDAFARQWREAGGDVHDFWRLLEVIEGHVFEAMPWNYRKPIICSKYKDRTNTED